MFTSPNCKLENYVSLVNCSLKASYSRSSCLVMRLSDVRGKTTASEYTCFTVFQVGGLKHNRESCTFTWVWFSNAVRSAQWEHAFISNHSTQHDHIQSKLGVFKIWIVYCGHSLPVFPTDIGYVNSEPCQYSEAECFTNRK